MLRCTECECVSEKAPGWVAMQAYDPDEDERPLLVVFCPVCAAREFGFERRATYT